jgi:hypothetical protein
MFSQSSLVKINEVNQGSSEHPDKNKEEGSPKVFSL